MHFLILSLWLFTNPTLTWEDFKAPVPNTELNVGARTRTSLEFSSTDSDGIFTCRVEAVFLSSESWVRIKSDANLSHELTHWRICELKAALCNKALDKYQNKRHVSEAAVMKIYKHYQWEIDDLNQQFDHETNHGQNPVTEAAYERHILNDLNKLQ